MSRNTLTASKEIEQRFAVDHTSGLYLPHEYKNYHQAELGSGKVREVIEEFTGRTSEILSRYTEDKKAIIGLLNLMKSGKPLKIRIRRISDPNSRTKSSELTLKQKAPHPKFKIYDEYTLPIDDGLALELIEHIAPPIEVPGTGTYEYGVTKRRFTPLGPDGKMWDLDMYQGLNTGLYIAEIEVASTDEKVELPPWVKKRMNGFNLYKAFGTGELQKVPFQLMPASLRERFLLAQGLSHKK